MTTILSDRVDATKPVRSALPAWRNAGTGFVEAAVSLVAIVVLTAFGGLSMADAVGGIVGTRPSVVAARAPAVGIACEPPHAAL